MNLEEQKEQENVEIYIQCRSLKDMETFSKTDSFVILFQKNENGTWAETARTEIIWDNLNPNFAKTFIINYHFEKQQFLKFDVLQYDKNKTLLIGSVQVQLGSIVGSKNSTIVMQLYDENHQKSGKIILRAEKVMRCQEFIKMRWNGYKIKDTRFFGKTNPFLKFYKINEKNSSQLVYQTEVVMNNLNPEFKEFTINLGKLANGDIQAPVLCQFWDYNSNGKHDLIGQFQFSVNELNKNQKLQLKALDKKQNLVGTFYTDYFRIDICPSFLDYIRGGTQLALIAAIDFTASNGDADTANSLHSLNQQQFNQYQQALKVVGQILLNYDHDKKVPMFGFGGKPQMPNLTSNVVLHCFPMTGNQLQPEVEGINGIMNCYKYCLQNTILSGPTLFGPIIQETMRVAEAAKNLQKQDVNEDQYFILLILTDGEIHDMDITKGLIVKSAQLPLSIIIIGIGNADFKNMDILDGDNGLWDANGNKAERDLVQFVPFNEYKNNPIILAEKVLEELPTQIEEYMSLVNRKPLVQQQQINIQFTNQQTFIEEDLITYNNVNEYQQQKSQKFQYQQQGTMPMQQQMQRQQEFRQNSLSYINKK